MAAVWAFGSCSRMMPFRAIEPLGQQLQFLVRRHHDSSRWPTDRRRTPRCRAPAAGRAWPAWSGSPESGRTACSGPWSRRRAAPFRPPRCRGRFRSVGFVGVDLHQAAVRPGVVADGVAFGRDPPHQIGMFRGGLADQEEGRLHAFVRQRRQHFRRRRRPRAVIEGQHHLMIPQRQRLRKVLQPDPRRGGGIDMKNARGAERVLARTFRRLAPRRSQRRSNERSRRQQP